MWGTWGYWRGQGTGEFVYSGGTADRLTQWRIAPDGRLDPTPVARSGHAYAYPGAVPVVSSNGSATGIGVVWTVDQTGDQATLRAFDAADVGHELWNGPIPGGLNHFAVPTVAAGKVFVGGTNALEVFGLTPCPPK
jgi:hypothetical protein